MNFGQQARGIVCRCPYNAKVVIPSDDMQDNFHNEQIVCAVMGMDLIDDETYSMLDI